MNRHLEVSDYEGRKLFHFVHNGHHTDLIQYAACPIPLGQELRKWLHDGLDEFVYIGSFEHPHDEWEPRHRITSPDQPEFIWRLGVFILERTCSFSVKMWND